MRENNVQNNLEWLVKEGRLKNWHFSYGLKDEQELNNWKKF